VHNFSLVHDDIQDNSDKRRGRPTLWTKWGMPQAINTGDGLFVLSNLAVSDLAENYLADTALRAARALHETCLDLTRGQYMDISYEDRLDLDEDDYWPMITGKTAALLAGCCQMGAILGGAAPASEAAYRDFGLALGLAFQVQDDILGIWGDEAVTGKSAASDLLEGKKSLPVLYGLGKNGPFAANAGKAAPSPRRTSSPLPKNPDQTKAPATTRKKNQKNGPPKPSPVSSRPTPKATPARPCANSQAACWGAMPKKCYNFGMFIVTDSARRIP
jgi:geranylgeranyl pyrophosphate synthase